MKNKINKRLKGASMALLILISLLIATVTPVISSDNNSKYETQDHGTAVVSWSPSSTDVELGDSFNLTMYIDSGAWTCRGFTIRILLFNSSVLGMANITPGGWTGSYYKWNTSWSPGIWGSADQKDGGKLHNDVGNLTYVTGGYFVTTVTGNHSALIVNMTAEDVGVLNVIIPSTAPWNPGQAGIEITDIINVSWYNTSVTIHPQQILSMSATAYNYTAINITNMVRGNGSDNVTLCGKAGSYPTDPEDGVLYNGTNTTYNHTGLNPCTTYYYRAWGWNVTSSVHSVNYVSTYATTSCYTNFSFAGVTPTNSSVTSNCTYSIPINLTVINSRGRTFSYWINASNGQSTSGAGQAANTSVGRTLTGLSHNTNYQWNVTVAEVTAGSGDSYTQTYNFTTGRGGGSATVASTPLPVTGNSSVPVTLNSLSVLVTDADSDPIRTWFFLSGTLVGTDTATPTGQRATTTFTTNLYPNTTYSWYVITNDSCQNTTSATWTFTTDIANVSINKEWHVVDATNQIVSYINISNCGEMNLTDVNITDTWDTNLAFGGAHPWNDSGNSHSWTIPWLNLTGYDNHTWNITLYLNLSGAVANGTTFTNSVTATANYTVNRSSAPALTMCYYVYKESYTEILDWNSTNINWSINVTNCGDFYLDWIQINETYSPNLTYHSSNISAGYNGTTSNVTFNITQLAPGSSFHLWILMNTSYVTGAQLVNGSKIWNNITANCNQTTADLTEDVYVYAGAVTTFVRIHYTTQFTDVISITNSVFLIIGAVMIIALIMGVMYIFYRSREGGYE